MLPWSSSLEVAGPVVVALRSPRWCLWPVVVALVLLAGGGWAVFRCPVFSSLVVGPVVVALVLLAGVGGLCFVAHVLLAGARAVRCCPCPPRCWWSCLSLLPCVLLAGAWGRPLLPSSSLLGVVGLCFGALVLLAGDWACRCGPRLPRAGVVGLCFVALVSSLVFGAGRWCHRPPCWGWLGGVSLPFFACSPRWSLGLSLLPSSSLLGVVGVCFGAVVLLAGGRVGRRCPRLPRAGVGWAVLRCPRAPPWSLGLSVLPCGLLAGGGACRWCPVFSSVELGAGRCCLVFSSLGAWPVAVALLLHAGGGWGCVSVPLFSSLVIGAVVVALVFPVWGLVGLCVVPSSSSLELGAGRCCPGPPRSRWLGLSLLPCVLLAGEWGRSLLRSSSLLEVVGWCFGALVLLAGVWGRSLLPSSSLLGMVGRCVVALVLLAGDWAGRWCPRPPCWEWLGMLVC